MIGCPFDQDDEPTTEPNLPGVVVITVYCAAAVIGVLVGAGLATAIDHLQRRNQ